MSFDTPKNLLDRIVKKVFYVQSYYSLSHKFLEIVFYLPIPIKLPAASIRLKVWRKNCPFTRINIHHFFGKSKLLLLLFSPLNWSKTIVFYRIVYTYCELRTLPVFSPAVKSSVLKVVRKIGQFFTSLLAVAQKKIQRHVFILIILIPLISFQFLQ